MHTVREFVEAGGLVDRRARHRHGVDRTGKPWQNGVTGSFNSKFRDECLSLEWFRSRAEAKVIIEAWRRHYNEVRPHSSLDYLTPNEFAARAARPAPRQATGRDAAVHGASAPRPVAEPSPRGQRQPASRLKLTVVRRRAGHDHGGAQRGVKSAVNSLR